MFKLVRVLLAPSRGTREESARDLAEYADLESAISAMQRIDPSRAARLEVRDAKGYTLAKWELDTSRADTLKSFKPRAFRHSAVTTALPVLTRVFDAPITPLRAGREPIVPTDKTAGPYTDPDIRDESGILRVRPLFDRKGRPVKSRARRRAERKAMAAGIEPETQLATARQGYSKLDAIRPAREPAGSRPAEREPARIPHSVSVQVAPFAPLRSRVSGSHSRLARLDATAVKPTGRRIDGRPVTRAAQPTAEALHARAVQEEKQVRHYDHETGRPVDTMLAPAVVAKHGKLGRRTARKGTGGAAYERTARYPSINAVCTVGASRPADEREPARTNPVPTVPESMEDKGPKQFDTPKKRPHKRTYDQNNYDTPIMTADERNAEVAAARAARLAYAKRRGAKRKGR